MAIWAEKQLQAVVDYMARSLYHVLFRTGGFLLGDAGEGWFFD